MQRKTLMPRSQKQSLSNHSEAISEDVDTFLKNRRGWVLDRVIKTYVNIALYKSLKGNPINAPPKWPYWMIP